MVVQQAHYKNGMKNGLKIFKIADINCAPHPYVIIFMLHLPIVAEERAIPAVSRINNSIRAIVGVYPLILLLAVVLLDPCFRHITVRTTAH